MNKIEETQWTEPLTEYTAEQIAVFQEKFRGRRRRTLVILFVLLLSHAVAVYLYAKVGDPHHLELWQGVLSTLSLAALIGFFVYANGRLQCPACGSGVSRPFMAPSCKSCGIAFG